MHALAYLRWARRAAACWQIADDGRRVIGEPRYGTSVPTTHDRMCNRYAVPNCAA